MNAPSDGWVTIARYGMLHEGQLAKVQLELAGFQVFLADEHMNTLRGGINAFGVRVQVPESAAAAARKILSAHEESLRGGDAAVAECPNCGSTKTGESWGRLAYLLTMLFFGLPTLPPAKRMRCKDCGHRWKSR